MFDNLKEILEMEDKRCAINLINEISNEKELHILIYNYNWDNGFEIPIAVINNKFCDFATALMTFYLSDGYSILTDIEILENNSISEWKSFIINLLDRIRRKDFKTSKLSYSIPLSKVQLFKIRKSNFADLEILLTDVAGEEMDIPLL